MSPTNSNINSYINSDLIAFKLNKANNQGQLIKDWWAVYKYEFSYMSQVACDYLLIPALEVNVKRLFNIGRDVLGIQRFLMTRETLKTCIILKDFLWQEEEGQI
jgi:hypothetical protein